MDVTHSFLWVLTGGGLYWLPISSQFVKQPTDANLVAVTGYPLTGHIPCVLKTTNYNEVGWEQWSGHGKAESISENRTIHSCCQRTYEFIDKSPLDYSIRMKLLPSNELQLRCYVIHPNSDNISYSSWSNITYTALPLDTYPKCSVEPSLEHFEEGDTILLICKSKGAVPAATLKLLNGTSGLLPSKTHKDNSVESNITVSKYDNEKQFYCAAENEATRKLVLALNCSVFIEVRYMPYITDFVADQENSAVWCKVDSNPPAIISIFNLSDETSQQLAMLPGGGEIRQPITSARCLSKIWFKCQAENQYGSAEKNISITAGCRPRIGNNASIIYVEEKSGLFWMETNIIACPKPYVTCHSMHPNGSRLEMGRARYFFKKDEHPSLCTNVLKMLIEGANRANLGQYQCNMTNSLGSSIAEFRVVGNVSESTKGINGSTQDVAIQNEEWHEIKGQITWTLIVIISSVILIFLMLCTGLLAIAWKNHPRFKERGNGTQATFIESTETQQVVEEEEEVATVTVEVMEILPREMYPLPPDPPVESDNDSVASSAIYDMPQPKYVNEHMMAPVYAYIQSEDEHSSLEDEYEEIGNSGYEIPVSCSHGDVVSHSTQIT